MAQSITDLHIGRDRRSVMVCTGLDFRVIGLQDSTGVMYRVGNYARGGLLAGSNLVFPSDGATVFVWDDAQKREAGILHGKSDFGAVQRILASKGIVAVVCDAGLILYSLPNMNIFGSAKFVGSGCKSDVCDLDRDGTVLIRPGRADGVLHVEPLIGDSSSGVYEVRAHQHPLRIARLSDDGKLIATASVRGTLVRVFDTATSAKVAEFRCGSFADDICALEFDHTNALLLVGCGRTLHVFSVAAALSATMAKTPSADPTDPAELVASTLSAEQKHAGKLSSLDNARSLIRYVPLAPAYYSSTWSARQYSLDKYEGGYVCGFTDDNSHIAVLMRSGLRVMFPFLNTGQVAPADVKPVTNRYV